MKYSNALAVVDRVTFDVRKLFRRCTITTLVSRNTNMEIMEKLEDGGGNAYYIAIFTW